MNPFNLPGPQFLTFYLVLIGLAFLLGLTLHYILLRPWSKPSSASLDLHHYEIGYLAGGAKSVVQSAIARMTHNTHLVADGKTRRIVRRSENPVVDGHPLEQAIYEHTNDQEGVSTNEIYRQTAHIAEESAKRPQELELIVPEENKSLNRIATCLMAH